MGLKDKTKDPLLLRPYKPENVDTSQNQFTIFLKPETTAIQEGAELDEILRYILRTFEKWAVEIGGVRILTADYLARHEIMDRHYGVINKISKHGDHAISVKAKQTLDKEFANDLESGAEVLGGHQFLARFSAFSAFALAVLSDNMGVQKLAGGTYCLRIQINGEIFLILNAFHPYQLENFTTGNKAIVVMEGRSNSDWVDLRRKMLGATNPVYAFQGSIRQTLLNQRERFGLTNVSQSANGIHLSAGPLEGMVELQRFFSDPDEEYQITPDKTFFGQRLLEEGLSEKTVTRLADNLDTEVDGHTVSAFDFTEEINSDEATAKLLGFSESIQSTDAD